MTQALEFLARQVKPASRNYFTPEELQCRCSQCQAARRANEVIGFNADQVDPLFLLHVNSVREGLYGQAMPVTSGFRCLAHPREVSKVQKARHAGREFVPGDHPSGLGIDVGVAGEQALYLMRALHVYNWTMEQLGRPQPFTAISSHQRGSWAERFVHIGGNPEAVGRPRPHTWTY